MRQHRLGMPARCFFVLCSILWFRRSVSVWNDSLNLKKLWYGICESVVWSNKSINFGHDSFVGGVECFLLTAFSLSLCLLSAVAEIQDVVSEALSRSSILGPRFRIRGNKNPAFIVKILELPPFDWTILVRLRSGKYDCAQSSLIICAFCRTARYTLATSCRKFHGIYRSGSWA